MRRLLPALAVLVALLAAALGPAVATAQDAPPVGDLGPASEQPTTPKQPPRASLIDLEDELMCVTCKIPLNIAESAQATAQRREVQRLVDEGLTKDQIKARLVAEYGEDVLAEPPKEGFDLAAWLVPIVFVLALLTTLGVLVPRWRRRAPERAAALAGAVAATPVLTAEDDRRLDDELRRYEQ